MSIDNIQTNINANVKKITGESGSYDSSTSKGKAANAGEEVGKLLNGSEKDVATSSDISYSSKTEGSSVDVDAGLAYSEEVVKSVDDNDDGGITLDKNDDSVKSSEQKKAEEGLGIEDLSVADLNTDGIIDKAEYLSLTILQDCTSEDGPDAIATAEEAVALNEYIKADAEEAVANIKAIHDGLVAEKAENFEMPLKKAEQALEIAEENEDAAKEAIISLDITEEAQAALVRTAHGLAGTDNGKIRGIDFVNYEKGFRRYCKEMDKDGDSYVSKEEAERYINNVSYQTDSPGAFNYSGETAVFVAENFGLLTQAAKGKEDAFYIYESFNGNDGIRFDVSKADLYTDIIADEIMKDDRVHHVTGFAAGRESLSVFNMLWDKAGSTSEINHLEFTDELVNEIKESYITTQLENKTYTPAQTVSNEFTVQQTSSVPASNSVSSSPAVASTQSVSQANTPVAEQNAIKTNEQTEDVQQLIQLLQFSQMLGVPVETLAEMMNIDLSEINLEGVDSQALTYINTLIQSGIFSDTNSNLFQSIIPETQQEQPKTFWQQILELFNTENKV